MTVWTDERVATLKRMWNEGASAAAIARELGGVTRNSVIGKVHRLGLKAATRTGAPVKPKAATKPSSKPTKAAKAKPTEKPPPQKAVRKAVVKQSDPPSDSPWDDEARKYFARICGEDTTRADALMKMRDKFPERNFIPVAMAAVARGMGIKFVDEGSPLTVEDNLRRERVSELEEQIREDVSRGKVKKLTTLELTERTCRWPIGDPSDGEFWYCGAATCNRPNGEKSPYCAHHTEVAYMPDSFRRKRRNAPSDPTHVLPR